MSVFESKQKSCIKPLSFFLFFEIMH